MRTQASLPKSCFLSSSGTLPYPHGQALNVVSAPAHPTPPLAPFPQTFLRGPGGAEGCRKKDLCPPPIALTPQLCLSPCLPCPGIDLPLLCRLGLPINVDPQLLLQDQVSKDKAFQTMATMSSAQLISAPSLQAKLGPAGPQVA